MPVEFDDTSLRIIGNNVKAVQFFDDERALRAEIYLDRENRLNIGAATLVTGGSTPSGAPVAFAQAPFLTLQAHPDLLAERVFAPGGGLSASDGGPGGVYTLSVDSSVVRTNRTLTAGAGLIGGGDLSANRTFDVGAGTGITVNANDVAVNVGHAFTWTAGHTFQATIQARTILPELTDTYDLGSSTKLWRKGWLSELDAVLFAQNAVTVIGGWLIVAKGEGVLGTDLGSGAGDTTADLGTTANISAHATTGDIILFRAAGQVEYMKVTSGSGPTWTVTRDLDGSGRNAWPAGSVFVNLGYNGTGRIELNANSTPRISIVRQGTTYNAQTEVVRVGDMNGAFGVASELYGLGVGDYAGGNYLLYETAGGLVISAGGGPVKINATGITIAAADTTPSDATTYRFTVGGTNSGGLSAFFSGSTSHQVFLEAKSLSGRSSTVAIQAAAPASQIASFSVAVVGNNGSAVGLLGLVASGSAATFTVTAGTTTLSGGLNVGGASGAGAGDIRASGEVRAVGVRPGTTNSLIYATNFAINAGATANIGQTLKPRSLFLISDGGSGSGNNIALYWVNGGGNTAAIISSTGPWGTAAGASSYNVYRLNDGGGDRFVLQNNTGNNLNFEVIEFRSR